MLLDWSLIPPFIYFFLLLCPLLSLSHSFIHILGAGGRSFQPPARPGHADPHWGADNWAAVIPWQIPAWRKARHPGSTLESHQPSSPWETAQVMYPRKRTGCYVAYRSERLRGCGQIWILTNMIHIIAVSWLYNIWLHLQYNIAQRLALPLHHWQSLLGFFISLWQANIISVVNQSITVI